MFVRKRRDHKPEFMNNILDEIYYPNQPICSIHPTSTEKKKNVFASFRPEPNTCVDYNISQTDAKLDAGPTKIHVQQTTAEYVQGEEVPPPLAFKRNRYCSGGPPQWEFVDEIWRAKQEELQKIYHREFRKRVAERKRRDKQFMYQEHKRVMKLVGPVWYQELSPNQVEIVEKLQRCIVKDLAEDTIINTKENIGNLGLVLRPNQAYIKKALQNCCSCPVEFLLVLYQLMNPKRKHYSVNDRLLLSAVVHLTMMRTLQELHVRIPSPPEPPVVSKSAPKKITRITYESPYLEPYTFKREPPKFSGIYRNKHVQHPQSPYFCYLKHFKKTNLAVTNLRRASVPSGSRRSTLNSISTRQTTGEQFDDEIEKEYYLAQQIYQELVDFKPVPTLLKPSKYITCDNFRAKLAGNEEERIKNKPPEVKETIKDVTPCYVPDKTPKVCKTRSVSCGCCLNASPKQEEKEISGCGCGGDSPQRPQGDADTKEAETCACTNKENIPNKRYDSPPPKPDVHVQKDVTTPVSETEDTRCKHAKDLEIYNEKYHLIRPSPAEKTDCSCKDKHRQAVDKPLCPCEKCEEERQRKNRHFHITGLTDQPTETTTIIDRVVLGKPCKCLKKYESAIEKYEAEQEEEAQRPCGCRKMATQRMEAPLCQCEKCQEVRRKKAAKLIIAGTKEVESASLHIIEGISTGRMCQCVQNYLKRVNHYEDFMKRKKAVADIKRQDDKYVIGGVATTPKGPAYVISGMRPPIDCACAKKAREEAARKHMEEIMPHIPAGRVQYGIIGVKETPTGNVYILNNAVPIEDCECVALYQQFTKQHGTCNQLYEQYLVKMKEDYNEFMQDMVQGSRRHSTVSGPLQIIHPMEHTYEDEETNEEIEVCYVKSKEKSLPCVPTTTQPESTTCTCTDPPPVENIETIECIECVCETPVVECVDCTCGPEEVEEVVEEPPKLKRYFIFDRISCNRKWQNRVVKKALKSMADDGYPLAKLPQSHKLPHFRLWMEMRCHKFWTQEDRYRYVFTSKDLWRHCHHCTILRTDYPTLDITRSQGQLMDFSQADTCRSVVNTALERFYRQIKQNRIHFSREFFPTTFSYEFPFNSWRNCYFAYSPTKEEEVHARFVWKKYDFKNVADMNRKCV